MSGGEEIVVSGVGMRTAVGDHATQTCASIRAGINRFAEWPHFGATLDEDDTALIASAVEPDLGNGSWMGKTEHLLPSAFYEALLDAGLYDFEAVIRQLRTYRPMGFLAVPHPERPGTSTEAFNYAIGVATEAFSNTLGIPALEVMALDQVSGFAAIARGVDALQRGAADVVIVAAVDSYLDPIFLGWLNDQRRLKVPSLPAGIIPGEAASVLVLERRQDVERRGGTARLRIGSVALDSEAADPASRDLGRPDPAARAVSQAIASAGGPDDLHRVIVDLNGERWRFLEWALVEGRCLDVLPRPWELWHPADCIGEVGAAFGPLAIGMAARAFARSYGARGALICAGTDRGERAAACVFAPQGA